MESIKAVIKLKNYIPPKAYLFAIISLAFTVPFVIFLLAPLEFYFYNAPAFIVSWNFLFPTFFVFASIVFIVFLVVLLLLWALLKKLKLSMDSLLLFIWGVIIASYVQMLFLNGRMTLMTGDETGYGAVSFVNILNLFIWALIAVTPLLMRYIFVRLRKEFKYINIFTVTVLFILCMQTAGVFSASYSAGPQHLTDDIPVVPSFEPTLRLSDEDNVIVFILDAFDVLVMRDVLEEYPEFSDILDGFTFYENNVSEYFHTFPSVVTMLTRHYYTEGQTFDEYIDEAWNRHTFIDELRDNGFSTNLYIDMNATYGNLSNIENRTDNLKSEFSIVANFRGIVRMAGLTSFGRLAPYLLKDVFLTPLGFTINDGLMGFDVSEIDELEVFSYGVSHSNDFRFFDYIRRNELTLSDKKMFFVYHMIGSHQQFDRESTANGYFFDDESGELVHGGNYIESTRACLIILNTYFDKMRELGVYDNSTIVLIGDHGRLAERGSEAFTTALLIKPGGASGALIAENGSELSHMYFSAGILDFAGLPHSDFGISYNDIIQGLPPLVRIKYDTGNWWRERETTQQIHFNGFYEISGDANDFSNWKFIPWSVD